MYDVLIIGGGPAGLAASVYGSCEGLKNNNLLKREPRRSKQAACKD